MKRPWICLLLALAPAASSAMPVGDPPQTAGDLLSACVDHLKGNPVHPSAADELWPHGDDFTCWNDPQPCGSLGIGSQNIPVLAACAVGDYQWIAKLAQHERQGGLFGREIGSPDFYFYSAVVAKLVALHDAREAGDQWAIDELSENLRAIWAYEALTAQDVPRIQNYADLWGNTSCAAFFPVGQPPCTSPPLYDSDAGTYTGYTVAVAGERWGNKQKQLGAMQHDVHGEILSWVLNYLGRSKRKNGVVNRWWQGAFAHLAGVDEYTDPIGDPTIFGITLSERNRLRQVVIGSATYADLATTWLAAYGLNRRYDTEIIRTTQAVQVAFFKSANSNKATQCATSLSNWNAPYSGTWASIRASSKNVGANREYSLTRVDTGSWTTLICRVNDGVSGDGDPSNDIWHEARKTDVMIDGRHGAVIYRLELKNHTVRRTHPTPKTY